VSETANSSAVPNATVSPSGNNLDSPDSIFPSSYVADYANVLSQQTVDLIHNYNAALEKQCQGAQFVVVTVKSLDGMTADMYAAKLANEWGVGGSSNNGTLLLFCPSEKRGWLTVGNGIQSTLDSDTVNNMLDTYFWPSSDVGNYDKAVTDFTYAILSWYDGYYGSNVVASNPALSPSPALVPVFVDGPAFVEFNMTVDEFVDAWTNNFPDANLPPMTLVDSQDSGTQGHYYVYMLTGTASKADTWISIAVDNSTNNIVWVEYCITPKASPAGEKISTELVKPYQAAIAILSRDPSYNYKSTASIVSGIMKSDTFTTASGIDYHEYTQDSTIYRYWGKVNANFYMDIQPSDGPNIPPTN